MSIFADLIGAVAGPPTTPEVPIANRLEARLAEAEAALPVRQEDRRQAIYRHEVTPSDDTAAALTATTKKLADAQQRVDDLRDALKVAQDYAVRNLDADTARQHAKRIKDLAAFVTSRRRAAKKLSAHLENAIAAWGELLTANEAVVRGWPSEARFPQGAMGNINELQQAVTVELGRLTAVSDPIGWAKIGRRVHIMNINPTSPAFAHPRGATHLPSLEAKLAQAGEYLLRVARSAPGRTRQEPVPAAPLVPLPNKVIAADVPDLDRLKQQWAELQQPSPPDPDEQPTDDMATDPSLITEIVRHVPPDAELIVEVQLDDDATTATTEE